MAIVFTALFILFLLTIPAGFFLARSARRRAHRSAIARRIRNV
jgi:hypothetical protein